MQVSIDHFFSHAFVDSLESSDTCRTLSAVYSAIAIVSTSPFKSPAPSRARSSVGSASLLCMQRPEAVSNVGTNFGSRSRRLPYLRSASRGSAGLLWILAIARI